MKLYRQSGKPLHLGRELGTGGEAKVYALGEILAVKIYHRPDEARGRKLAAMVANKPTDLTLSAGHVSLAWPQELVLDRHRQVVGFVMPQVDTRRSIPLHQVYNPKCRLSQAPGITWRYALRIAHNLCAVVAALHENGYVIGDLNESNVLVADNALVTLVDCDSVQVCTVEETFCCPVGKGEYTAPELQGRSFRDVLRSPDHDTFALAVLVFLLLMEGVSPFAGVYRGEGEPPSLPDNIRAGRSPYLGSRNVSPTPIAPPFSILPPTLRKLMRRALTRPRWFSRRPSARRWQHALQEAESQLAQCESGSAHVYGRHLRTCPWCARKQALAFDAYPSTLQGMPVQSHVRTKKHVSKKTVLGGVLRRFPLVSLCILALALCLGYFQAAEVSRHFTSSPWSWLGIALAFVFPTIAMLLWIHARALTSAPFYRALIFSERLGRSVLGATCLALLIGSTWGYGEGWLFLLPFWMVSYYVFWRLLGRRSS